MVRAGGHVSALLLAAGATDSLLRRRGRPWRAGGIWIAAVVVGLVVEVTGKLVIPQIVYSPSSTVFGVTINGTYPSGHTTRSVIVAAMVVSLWPRAPRGDRLGRLRDAVLELGGLHVPSDIAGGFLIGGALTAAALAYSGDAIRAVRRIRPTIRPPCTCESAPTSRRTRSGKRRRRWRPATGCGSSGPEQPEAG